MKDMSDTFLTDGLFSLHKIGGPKGHQTSMANYVSNSAADPHVFFKKFSLATENFIDIHFTKVIL